MKIDEKPITWKGSNIPLSGKERRGNVPMQMYVSKSDLVAFLSRSSSFSRGIFLFNMLFYLNGYMTRRMNGAQMGQHKNIQYSCFHNVPDTQRKFSIFLHRFCEIHDTGTRFAGIISCHKIFGLILR